MNRIISLAIVLGGAALSVTAAAPAADWSVGIGLGVPGVVVVGPPPVYVAPPSYPPGYYAPGYYPVPGYYSPPCGRYVDQYGNYHERRCRHDDDDDDQD